MKLMMTIRAVTVTHISLLFARKINNVKKGCNYEKFFNNINFNARTITRYENTDIPLGELLLFKLMSYIIKHYITYYTMSYILSKYFI